MLMSRRARRGFTLAEILVAFTVVGILGTMIVRIVLSQSRFTDQQNAIRGARAVSRQALNILESELRMVQDSGGIDSAAVDGKAIRAFVPFRFGLYCGVSTGGTVVSMLPVDSLTLAQAIYAGWALRNSAGNYTTILPGSPLGADLPVASTDPAQCTGTGAGQAQIRTLSINGRTGAVLDVRPARAGTVGQPVFFFQRITYAFQPSTTFPGRWALYRMVQGGPSEELMAPFDSTARFKYWTRGAAASVSAPPALGLIRGIDVVFAARSRYTPLGRTSPSKAMVVASIFFRNVRSN
ncbi:MAG TPA: type II secretion system protein [Gemmatimonadaceae bacterium]|nr:type II secretion system protein [Gemmatimonadaceae bacterium]